MNVSPAKPFKLIYSLFQHEYLGYLVESFVVQVDEKGRLSLASQNISFKNAQEFAAGLDEVDYELIKTMDSMQQDAVVSHFHKKKIKPAEFFLKTYDTEKGNKLLQQEIEQYLERRRGKLLPLMVNKEVYEMGRDGDPAWKKLEWQEEPATVLFHFRRNEENTHYFPTLKLNGEKLEFNNKGAYIVSKKPAWMVMDNMLFTFKKEVDGHKLMPFLNKKFIVIPKSVEDTYYRKFVAPLVAAFDVYAKGFTINTVSFPPKAVITFSELASTKELSLFSDEGNVAVAGDPNDEKMLFELVFQYGPYKFKAENLTEVSVSVEQNGDDYTFHRVNRDLIREREIIALLKESGLELKHAKATLNKGEAFSWMSFTAPKLAELGVKLQQNQKGDKRYFIGTSQISIEVRENIDWFDIFATVRFGEFEIPFQTIRKHIIRKQREITLPNGEIAVIPEAWFTEYSELFNFAEDGKADGSAVSLKKHHLALVKELSNSDLATVTLSRKLEKLRGFEEIEDFPAPLHFKGTLRPYQKAGFNWLRFLNSYNFGGCLADDMGLGKTVQTLAMLQAVKEEQNGNTGTSLLVMPTSLIYNWEKEAIKFTPGLKVLNYTGTQREKDVTKFADYDLVLTSYGIVRLDIDLLEKFYFNYIILDESQAIKNPSSNIAKSVKKLRSKHKLILTGTPVENTTLDLWSQMSFINPGLLGNQAFFKNEFLNPIEKKNDEKKVQKLYAIIKPFILRRKKNQVATELPEKVENVQYCTMTAMQEEEYETAKSLFRNKIMDQIETDGVNKSHMILLQGLTKLRQIANHPKLVDPDYGGDSGKMEDVTHMLATAVGKDHKILVFSQFVKHLALLENYLKENRITYCYLDGSTKDRQAQVEKFQNDPSIKVFLISLKAGGLGLNLTKADYVFLLDPWWNPAVEAQAVDRAHRIGQENKVFTYKFITKNTVEEKILALQQSKMKLATELISTEESFVKNLSKEDIQNLLT